MLALFPQVLLPSDSKKKGSQPQPSSGNPGSGKERPPSDIGKQLDAVKAHIEDLEVVIARVLGSDDAQGYMSPLVSEFSELRLDY